MYVRPTNAIVIYEKIISPVNAIKKDKRSLNK